MCRPGARRRKKFCSAPSPPGGEDCARSIPSSSPHRTRSAGLRRGLCESPCELRVYGFKSIRDEWLHSDLCRSIGKLLPPEEHRYALIYEGRTELSPRDFWERCGMTPDPENGILENPVQKYQVLEIDDGLKPVFFYKTGRGFKLLYFFNTEIVRENKLEED